MTQRTTTDDTNSASSTQASSPEISHLSDIKLRPCPSSDHRRGGRVEFGLSARGTRLTRLTKKTDDAGNVETTAGVHIYGPYLRRFPPIPVGPNVGAGGVRITNNMPFAGETGEWDDAKGWVYQYETGEIIANTDDMDRKGVGYDTS